MRLMTQQNAASSEEPSSAAEELNSQAKELAALVGSFRTKGAAARKPQARALSTRRSAPAPKPKASNGMSGHPLLPKPEDVIPLEGETFKEF